MALAIIMCMREQCVPSALSPPPPLHLGMRLIFFMHVYIVSWKTAHSQKSAHPQKSALPLLWPNFLFRVKVYSKVRPAWSKLHVATGVQLRSTVLSAMHIWGKKLCDVLHRTRQLCVDGRSIYRYTLLSVMWVTWCRSGCWGLFCG